MDDTEQILEELDNLIGEWQVCQSCRVVDKDRTRTRVGSSCAVCGKESEGGLMFFMLSVHTIVDLIKEAYTTPPSVQNRGAELEYNINTHNISVLLFFCTLREMLMQGFVREICIALNIPKDIYERLNSDNRLHSQKQDRLFPSLTGAKWKKALEELEEGTTKNYSELNKQVTELVSYRNKFLHKGQKIFDIDESVANKCLVNIRALVHLYVDLHNKYVHRIYMDRL